MTMHIPETEKSALGCVSQGDTGLVIARPRWHDSRK